MLPIVISDFNKGIGASEFTGNGEMTNVDIDWRTGLTRIANEPLAKGTASALPLWIVPNKAVAGQMWSLDNNNNLYRGTASTETWATAEVFGGSGGKGLGVWKDHVFVIRQQVASSTAFIDVYGPLSGSATIRPEWQTITSPSVGFNPILHGQDDILYFGAGRYIASLQEVAGQDFQAGTVATYTFNQNALDLPEDYKVRCLGELGKNLMIGTWMGATLSDYKVADIFPWDRVSDSFNLPLRIGVNGVQAMQSVGNLLYFAAGTDGQLFVTDGTSIQELVRTPQHIVDLSGGNATQTRPGAMMHHKGKIYYTPGVGASYAHVWSYDLKTGALVMENTVSSGTATSGGLGTLFSSGRDDYWIGYNDSASNTFKFDHIQTGQRYSNYVSQVTSPWIAIGSKNNPEPTSKIEVTLGRPLASNQGIRLWYRTNLGTGFTIIDTIDFSTYGATQFEVIPFQVELTGGIQIRAQLTTGSGSSTSPELVKITIS